jgi:hypothetical protein
LLAFAFNTACHETTKYCPARWCLRIELAIPLDRVWDMTAVNAYKDLKKGKVSGPRLIGI